MLGRFLFSRARREGATIAAAGAATATPIGIVAASAAVFEVGLRGSPPKSIQLLPMGPIQPRGDDPRGPWLVRDREHAEQILAATAAYAGSMELSVDYDHQALKLRQGAAVTAPAAAWLSNLRVEDDGIWADAAWTPAAAAAIKACEYRYISPVFTHTKDGVIIALQGASLVNTPAIDTLAAAAASMEPNMDKIAMALGLAAGASEADILAAIAKMNSEEMGEPAAAKMAACAAKLGLPATAGLDEIVAAASAVAKPDPAAFVPIAAFTELSAKVAALTADTKGKDAEAFLAGASAQGKLTPAMTDWARDLFVKDEASARAWLKDAPIVVAAGEINRGGKLEFDGTAASLTADELSAAKMVGVTPEAFAKAKKGNI